MMRGLVIGKFLPIHNGHVALIHFAARHCDEVIVSMSFTETDPIPATLRFSWIEAIFKNEPSIKLHQVLDDFDDETLPLEERTKLWAAFIRKTFPPIDIIFSSEEYGEPFAKHLGAAHISFDAPRKKHPVSATLIRKEPFRHWDFIPAVVRPYFVKKICLYGPESTGKSVMTERLAKKYHTESVPEVARELITSNDFTLDDIIRIGHAQYNRIQEKLRIANKILICDTDAITTAIYSQHYLHAVPPVIHELEHKVHYDQYFLFDTDVPWVADGMRDLEEKRREMFHVFREALEQRGIDYILVRGNWEEREAIISEVIDRWLNG